MGSDTFILAHFRTRCAPGGGECDHGLQSLIARISRKQNEVRQFCAEMHKPPTMPWLFAIGGMIVGAALFGAGAAFMKLLAA